MLLLCMGQNSTLIRMLTIMFSHICGSNVHLVRLINGRLGHSCEVHSVCGSSVVADSIVTLKNPNGKRGLSSIIFGEIWTHLLQMQGWLCSKSTTEENADDLYGAFRRVILVVTQ
jgi:hypothetical protein